MPYRPYPNADRALRQLTRQREVTPQRPSVVFTPAPNELTEWARWTRAMSDDLGRAGASALALLAAQGRPVAKA